MTPEQEHTKVAAARSDALAALDKLRGVHEAAKGRGLTQTQMADVTSYKMDLEAAISDLPGWGAIEIDDWTSSANLKYLDAFRERIAATESTQERIAKIDTWRRANPEKARGADDVTAGSHGGIGGSARGEIREMLAKGETVRYFDVPKALATFAISDTADSTSLYVSDFARQVAMYMRTLSPWMGLANVVRADNGRPLVVPKITADTTVYSPGEGTAITESTPTLGSGTATLSAYKSLSYVSAEALEDVEYDLEDALAKSAARSIALSAGSAFTVAVLAGVNNGGTATGTPFYSMDDLIGLGYGRAAPYREAAGSSWVMANGAISKTRKLKDSQNQYLWQPSGIAGQPDGLLGSGVFEDPYLATPGSASKSVLFGDWRSALMVKATNLRVEVSREFKFDTDQVAFKTVLRAGIVVQDPAAAAFLVSGNS